MCHEGAASAARIASGESGGCSGPRNRSASPAMSSAMNVPPVKAGSAIGMIAAVSIGIGGMVGAGIFSILGVVAHAAGNAMWLAFAIGGVVALLSTYSYAKLGATFPSAGGAVHFLVKSFGDGVLAGGLNLFMWAGYIISLALYATAFGGYAATVVTATPSPGLLKSLAVVPVLVLTLVKAFGAPLMGRGETLLGWGHARSPKAAAEGSLHQRDPRDRSLSRRFADRHRQLVGLRNRAGQGLCVGRGSETVFGTIRFPADCYRRPVLHGLGDQRHAVWLRQRLLHDRPRWRTAGRTLADRMERRDRRATAHGRPGCGGDVDLRPLRHRDDGKRRLPLDLCRGERGPPEGARSDWGECDYRLALAAHLPGNVRCPLRVHLPGAAPGDRRADPHRRSVIGRRMGLPALDRAQDHGTSLANSTAPVLRRACLQT